MATKHAERSIGDFPALRASRRAALVIGLALAPAASADPAPVAPVAPIAPVDAAPRFELLDRGDAVEVIAHGVKAARTAVLPVRSRLEVPIASAPSIKRVVPGDATVKLIEFDRQDSGPVLSVKLGFERADVKTLSRYAQAIQVGDDLHLLVPRKLPEGDVAPRLPEPTVPPALAARAEATPPAITVHTAPIAAPAQPAPIAAVAQPAPAAETAKHEPPAAPPPSGRPRSAADAIAAGQAAAQAAQAAQAGSPSAAPAATQHEPTAAATHAAGSPTLRQTLAPEHEDAWSKISLYAALGLAAAGAGIWLMRRRRAAQGPGMPASIDVIAQRSLGGKARIVWLRAGQREMIISVTAQQVRMLGQWRSSDAAAAETAALGYAELASRRETLPPPMSSRTTSQMAAMQPMPPRMPRSSTSQMAAQVGAMSGATSGAMSGPTMSTSSPMPPILPADKPVSPAVSGLLRLRGRTGQMPAVNPDLADGDVVADELWAKEILAATQGARR